jgi:hypothetical protein
MEGNPSIYKGLYKWRVTLPFIKGLIKREVSSPKE